MSDFDDDDTLPSYKKEHALEKFLNIEPTPLERVEYEAKPITKHEAYDKKDSEIEEQMQEVFIQAMRGYTNLDQYLDSIEPKYRARMAEVALQYLKTGLDAANSKGKIKADKDKIDLRQALASKGTGKGNTNVIITADRNEFLRELRKMSQEEIEGEVVEKNESD